MPVVNLPQDTRWGDLGKGLGGLASGIVQGLQQQQTQAAVSEIMQDPTIPEPAKYSKILKEHGTLGQELYTKAVTNQLQQAKIKDTLSEVGLRTVQTAAKQAELEKAFPEQVARIRAETANVQSETARRTTLLPGEVTQQAAQAGLTGAQAGSVQSEEATRRALLPGQLIQQPAQTKLTGAEAEKAEVEAGLGAAKLPKVLVENEIAKIQLDIIKGNTTEGGAMERLDSLGKRLGLTPDLIETAKGSFRAEKDPLKKDEAFMKVVVGQKQAEARAIIPTGATEPTQKVTGQAVESATSMKTFLDSFTKGGAERMGNLGDILEGKLPASAKVFLEKHGFSTGDEQLISMWTASTQNSATTATSGGGFYSPGRYGLAKEITPGIGETPLHAIKIADDVADRQIALLENRKMSMAPKESKAGVEDALSRWKEIKAVTGTYRRDNIQPWTVAVNLPDGRTTTVDINGINGQQPPVAGSPMGGGTVASVTPKPGQTVDYFQGSQIDPKSFKKIVDAEKTYEFKGGQSIKGGNLITEARMRNVAPDVYLKQLANNPALKGLR